MGMIKCPECGNLSMYCLSTRNTADNRVRRRKECLKCGYRFTTYEVYEGDINEESFVPGKPGPKSKANNRA